MDILFKNLKELARIAKAGPPEKQLTITEMYEELVISRRKKK